MSPNFSRRRFIKGIGGAAAAASFPDVLRVVLAEAPTQSAPRARAIVFWEDDFPQVDGCGIDRSFLQTALQRFDVSYLSERELIAKLKVENCDLLITPYGSAFPKRAWPAVLAFLRAGGNLLNIGGAPFVVPVVRAGSRWRTEERQTAYHKQLGITQSFPVEAGAIASYRTANHFAQDGLAFNEDLAAVFKANRVYELYVRFTSSNLIPDESGSDGPREAALYPLVFGVNREQRPIAAPIVQIDRLQGEFAGGRWIFANFSGRISAAVIGQLAQLASQSAIEFRVRTEFACYRTGETPQFTIDLHRPRGGLRTLVHDDCRVEVRTGAGQLVSQLTIPVKTEGARATGSGRPTESMQLEPELYRVEARLRVGGSPAHELTYTSGFWVYDAKLLRSGKPLTVNRDVFHRDGAAFPVTGTTYMASDVHRQFLFQPNPSVWDEDFRAMKAAGVNLVRTGIWTGWQQFMSADGRMNEAALRALDAFLLTAHHYDIPVIFTLFAFLPETWGGKNAYLDPHSVQAQSQFVSALAQRYREVDDLIWDLINEPSFCSTKYLWSCRPNYDEHEKAAWQEWLKQRYPFPDDEARAIALQQLWRTADESPFALPRLEDFDGPNILNDRRPLKTLDYRLFAQDMFAVWVHTITDVIRSNGNRKQLITVGQDEGGLGDSPNPHFFGASVDFTCMHNWWANDDLVWDSVMAKTPGKPSLIEETGVMFYEKMDGSAWRSEEEARNLLERKLAVSFAAQGAGYVQWIWNSNCYMNSDNEAAIGFYRADQTAKPELDSFLKITKFIQTHRGMLRDREDEAVQMLIPHSQMFSPRSFATEVTRRCVRAMFYHCRVPVRTVSEYQHRDSKADANVIIVPAPRLLTEKCWQALMANAARGATIVISGVLDADEYGMSDASRYQKIFGREAVTAAVSESEPIFIGDREYLARYEGEKMQRIEKAVAKVPPPVQVMVRRRGAGRIVWSPLPLEASTSMETVVAFYLFALAQANVLPSFTISPNTPSVLVLPSIFEKHVLYTMISETSSDLPVTLQHRATRTRVPVTVPAGRTAFVLLDRLTGRVIDSTR